MTRAPQKRTLLTRARLLEAAQTLIAEKGHGALRVEEVVALARVAKGTFFSHFEDKDRLLAEIIGAQMHAALDDLSKLQPTTIRELALAHQPYFDVIAQNRTTVDIAVRYSGAAAIDDLGPITMAFGRHIEVAIGWMSKMPKGNLRSDLDAAFLAEGIQAFAVQAIALNFCALHSDIAIMERFTSYLEAWLASPK